MTDRPYPIRVLAAVLLGLPGVIALPTLAPLPPGIPPVAVMVNPAILLVLMACAGAWAAPRLGLRAALILGTPLPWRAPVILTGAIWAGAGLAAGLGVAVLDHATAPLWAPDGAATLRAERSVGDVLLGMLYGGLTEEVLLRWGLLSLIALGLARFLPRGAALWGAVVLAALAFALAHLPALALAVDALTPPLLLRTILWNLLLGLLYGAALLRHGLEAAILAHAATHLGFALAAL